MVINGERKVSKLIPVIAYFQMEDKSLYIQHLLVSEFYIHFLSEMDDPSKVTIEHVFEPKHHEIARDEAPFFF